MGRPQPRAQVAAGRLQAACLGHDGTPVLEAAAASAAQRGPRTGAPAGRAHKGYCQQEPARSFGRPRRQEGSSGAPGGRPSKHSTLTSNSESAPRQACCPPVLRLAPAAHAPPYLRGGVRPQRAAPSRPGSQAGQACRLLVDRSRQRAASGAVWQAAAAAAAVLSRCRRRQLGLLVPPQRNLRGLAGRGRGTGSPPVGGQGRQAGCRRGAAALLRLLNPAWPLLIQATPPARGKACQAGGRSGGLV